ncbi:MAG: glycosyl transferase [Cytophagales bacterium CG12_big_fil_rev_8_21_14_0_65_40_12]|nr:MAG: glycosyl transferase [Cytophagales bacterium CG12_big_fil_rev_8_21_14_0_65_40_12]PIW04227.1 MAG: hypothetical protein COW40_10880 [Cytophagales bacterium CG17_big_fil_post_rev_8_21_14_2_50_40_13]
MKKRPRVLIDSFHLLQALTGIRTYTTQLCAGLERLDFDDVEYLIYPNWRWLNQTTFLRGKVNVVKKLINHLIYFIWKQVGLPILIIIKRVDVIVAPDYLLPYFKFGARGIAVVHDTFYWELKGKYNPVWRWYFLKSVQLGLNKRSSMVVTSNYIAEKAKIHISNELQLAVVYQAPKNLEYGQMTPQEYRKIGLPENAKYFLHIGIFEDRKNLGILIKAFRQLMDDKLYSDFYLLLVGSRGVGWFHDDFNRLNLLIKEYHLEDKVIMPGFVPNEDLGKVYQHAFAYVFPSTEEGFGIPVIEAMKAGTPVIISNQPALMEIAGDAALVFDMNNEMALYDQMVKVTSPELREELIMRGNKRASKFTNASFVNQFHTVIKDCILSRKHI